MGSSSGYQPDKGSRGLCPVPPSGGSGVPRLYPMPGKIPDRYAWEAEHASGEIVTRGPGTDGSLKGFVRFSLIPAPGTGLPRHDFHHVRMVRRFGRGYIRVMGGGMADYAHCIVFETFRVYVSSVSGAVLVTPKDFELYI